uniref:tRNA(Ile)-lysidine synthase n=1 Tax=Schizymenia dubyi TaxID=38368 RepID=A0A1C9C9B4_9FLOR|nr:tRNA(Ile)-lysidine synthase [Schizymenia dubyi]AOM64976.1 tRNA(Ile)-lysidine synthase [Schizymenia dubyi]
MKTHLHQEFNQKILQILEANQIQSVLVAISGGQDSFCLIKLIQDFQKIYNDFPQIEYIYIDHQWRKDCKYQIQHLINYISLIKSCIYIYQIKSLQNSEWQARQLRYQIITKHSQGNQATLILTAHSRTDKIETFFQQLMRGSSLEGITSLTLQRKLSTKKTLVRPLINTDRTDIQWFCRKFNLPIWSDITNYQYKVNRNRLRNEFIPYLKQYFMPNIEKKINSFIDLSYIENEYSKQNAIKLYILSRHKNNIALNYQLMNKQHLAIQVKTLHIFFYHHFHKSLEKNTRTNTSSCKNKSIIKHSLLWGRLSICIENGWLYIS